jgi:hypothetical protein
MRGIIVLMLRLALALLSVPALYAGTNVLFDPATPQTGPFPTDYLTVPDLLQRTGERLNLPLPDCAVNYTACQETGLLEQYDGFSIRARAVVRFAGAVKTATLAKGVFYVALDKLDAAALGVHKTGDAIAIDQTVYDPTTNTLYAKPYSVLDQDRRYALVVTDAVQDAAGNPVTADPAYRACLASATGYCSALAQAVSQAAAAAGGNHIVAAAVFTTMSATSWLERARKVLDYVPPMPSLATPRSTFPIASLAGVVLHMQTGAVPPRFTDIALPVNASILAGVGAVVMGSYSSPNFLEDDQSIRPYPTVPDLEVPASINRVAFNALLPATPKPAEGYPVVIFGHGFGDSRFGGPTAVAQTFNKAGLAVIAIDAVGHGFGPLSTVTFRDAQGGSTTLDAGGRSIDLNGDGIIEANEGCALLTPVAFGLRDCFRQTAVDLMQLVRTIQGGLDLDGDGRPDLDASRIYYAGESLGAMYGSIFTAMEPAVRAAALNVGGASTVDIARWSPAYRTLSNQTLGSRIPSLLNAGTTYNQDYVLPGQPVHVTTVPGAMAIQDVFERLEWLGMPGDDIAFAPHLKTAPLVGYAARPVLMQFARGDMTVTNPANSALIRAAGLESSTWEYRHDLALAVAPDLPKDPHPYLVLFISLDGNNIVLPGLAGLAISYDAQQQIAGFLTSDGKNIPDPNNLTRLLLGTRLFEMPSALPFDFGY